MTYETDPIRWTENPNFAPEGLRDPLRAASAEGPSSAQIRTLALKLAAVSAGGVIAASAATAKASSTAAGGMAASASLPIAKVLVTVAVVGATALSGSLLYRAQPTVGPNSVTSVKNVPAPLAHEAVASKAMQEGRSNVSAPGQQAGALEQVVEPAAPSADEPVVERLAEGRRAKAAPIAGHKPRETRVPVGSVHTNKSIKRAPQTEAPREVALSKPAASHERTAEIKSAAPSEVELLRRARAALASSPREAFTLTEAHREHYPKGVFAQERDALAIEALMRAGDMVSARALAERFVRAHPSSPHAHRFREAMGLH